MPRTMFTEFRGEKDVAIGYRIPSGDTVEWWFEDDKFKDVELSNEEFHRIDEEVGERASEPDDD